MGKNQNKLTGTGGIEAGGRKPLWSGLEVNRRQTQKVNRTGSELSPQ